jgi:MbtH protein
MPLKKSLDFQAFGETSWFHAFVEWWVNSVRNELQTEKLARNELQAGKISGTVSSNLHSQSHDYNVLGAEKGMPMPPEEHVTVYVVLANCEEQYSIWPERRDIPAGWRAVGKKGSKPECLHYINEVWTDMRPLSLRKRMDGQAEAQIQTRHVVAAESQARIAEQPERHEQGTDTKRKREGKSKIRGRA